MIEFSQVISAISLLIAAVALFRNLKGDTKTDATQIAIITNKLDNIGEDVRDIKDDFKGMKFDVDGLKKSQILTEQSLKSAWVKIDEVGHEIKEIKEVKKNTST